MSWSSSCFSFLLRDGRSLTEGVVCSDDVGPEGVLQETGARRPAGLLELEPKMGYTRAASLGGLVVLMGLISLRSKMDSELPPTTSVQGEALDAGLGSRVKTTDRVGSFFVNM